MMSLRFAARSAPRVFSRASSTALRRCPATARTTGLLETKMKILRPQHVSAFSTSLRARAASGETDEELSAKLASEIEFEQDVKENEPLPASIKDFLDNGPFEIQDNPGKEEVLLTRTFGNEKITVSFSIADLQSYDPDLNEEDSSLSDDDLAEGGRSENGQNGREASELAGDEGEEGSERSEAAVPCRLRVIIEKPGHGALNVEATASDGGVIVENMYHYADASLARVESAEAAHKAQDVYPGPPFGSLDEDLQILMERYLEERGITQALAVFVPDYMDMKEQKEYMTWLNNVKNFVDA